MKSSISIHALRGEGDKMDFVNLVNPVLFLSTPSVGRATRQLDAVTAAYMISIHALRGEGDHGRIPRP